jgi:protein-tyrosine phosphatase
VFNLRDLGGYPTRSGRSTRWGRVFRSDGLHRTDSAGGEIVIGLGIRRVIDLRTKGEREREGVFDHALVEGLHVPLIDRTWKMEELGDGGEADFLLAGYLHMAHQNGPRVGEVISLIAEHASEPILFHCAAGKDRTGIIAALLLALVGVADDAIAEDFALSEAAMAAMTEWYKARKREGFTRGLRKMGIDRDKAMRLMSARPETIHRFLADVRRRHGSIEAYVAGVGVSDAAMARIVDHLVE